MDKRIINVAAKLPNPFNKDKNYSQTVGDDAVKLPEPSYRDLPTGEESMAEIESQINYIFAQLNTIVSLLIEPNASLCPLQDPDLSTIRTRLNTYAIRLKMCHELSDIIFEEVRPHEHSMG